jgi:hypothetical protein
VLVEERSRYCTFIACLKPVLGEEISLVSELQQLEEVGTVQIIIGKNCFLYRVLILKHTVVKGIVQPFELGERD